MNRKLPVAVLVLAVLLLPIFAQARQQAQIVDAAATRQGNDWVVSFHVAGSFTPKMEDAVMSGIPTTFTYYFALYRQINGWADERLFAWKVQRTIRYDNLKKLFFVVLDNEGDQTSFGNLEDAKEAMVTFKNKPVVVAGSLSVRQVYYLKVKAELDPVKLPIVLSELFFFVSLWDFKTPWVKIDLTEPAGDEL